MTRRGRDVGLDSQPAIARFGMLTVDAPGTPGYFPGEAFTLHGVRMTRSAGRRGESPGALVG